MRINSNYTMSSYNNRNCKKPSFQAKVDEQVQASLREKAVAEGREVAFDKKLARVSQWGDKDSVISVATGIDITDEDFKGPHLVLTNENKSVLYGAGFNIDNSLSTLDQFFKLTQKDIVAAEREIVTTARVAKLEGIKKIAQTPEDLKKITGKKYPSDKEFAAGISKLSEREIMEYRFDLMKRNERLDELAKRLKVDFEIAISDNDDIEK